MIVNGGYWPCRNIADAPCSDFVIDPKDYAVAAMHGNVEGVIHSHPQGGPASLADRRACAATKLPWHIWSVPDEKWLTIES